MNFDAVICGFLFIIPCILFLIFPKPFLTFGSKWKYKDAEPTEGAILIGRIVSVIGFVVGVGLVVLGIMWNKI